jgi:hypothetical protein
MLKWAVDNWFQILVVFFLFRYMRALHALARARVSPQTVDDYWCKLETLLLSINRYRQTAANEAGGETGFKEKLRRECVSEGEPTYALVEPTLTSKAG